MPAFNMTLTVDATDADAFRAGFLETFPNITLEPDPDPDTGAPIPNTRWDDAPLSDDEWIEFKILQIINAKVDKGRRRQSLRDDFTPPAPGNFVRKI